MQNQILIVDDSNSTCKLVEEYLKGSRSKAAFARSGAEALKKVKANRFDLILLDVNLPDIDGYKVCRQLKSNDFSKDIPVIFITVRTDPESMRMGFEAGGVDYLTKPFNREELLLRIKTHIDLKRSREALLLAKEQAEKNEKLKMIFISNMSHEIRTPMNSILGFSELLLDKGLTEEEKTDFINIIINNSHHLLNIINDILEISKQEAEGVKITAHEFSLDDFMENIQKTFVTRNRNTSIEIRLNIPKSRIGMIKTDEMRLQQIFDNLMNNAIKFTQDGFIELGYRLQKGNPDILEFFVKDTGIGISKDKQKIIFDRFTQVDDLLTLAYQGTGLGLPIINGIITAMGGTITLDSQPGIGSIFRFTIPYSPVAFVSDHSKTIEKSGVKGFIEGNWENKTFLIADDVGVILLFFKAVFRNTGAKLLFAKNGSEALSIFKKNRNSITLCILDLQMPLMSGLDLARAIREVDKKIPLIAQTGLTLTVTKDDILAAGFNDFLFKPLNLKSLQNILDKYIINESGPRR